MLIEILRGGNVRCVVDVRSIPRSRTNPQYNLDRLPETLAHWQIRHLYIPELGGRRGRQKQVEPQVNAFWKNQSFHNYADYALSDAFRAGLDELKKQAAEMSCAIMCSEAVWWRCHRSLIADYLKSCGVEIQHIISLKKSEPHPYTTAARLVDGRLSYAEHDPQARLF